MRWISLVALLAGCGSGQPDTEPPESAATLAPAPADSLASRPVPGVEIWFTVGRPARDSTGTSCYERTLEIRDSVGRRRVPLLYTLEAPTRLDDTSVRARVYLNCAAGDPYRVSLRTGRPTPLGR
jgi:hypothetical protein